MEGPCSKMVIQVGVLFIGGYLEHSHLLIRIRRLIGRRKSIFKKKKLCNAIAKTFRKLLENSRGIGRNIPSHPVALGEGLDWQKQEQEQYLMALEKAF